MPIVTIESLPPTDARMVPQMLADVQERGARALGCAPDNVWVIFRAVEHQASAQPPVVIVRAQAGRSAEVRHAFVRAVADAIGQGLEIPSANVWIHYMEMRPEDVWFEGRWAR